MKKIEAINVLFVEFLEKTSAIHLLPALEILAKSGKYQPILFGQSGSYLAQKAQEKGIKTYTISYIAFDIHKPRTYLPFLQALGLMCKIIIENRVHIIHCHRLNWAHLGVICSKIFHIPLLVDIVFMEQLTSSLQNFLINHHKDTVYLAISEFTRRKFHELYNVPLDMIRVLCFGIILPQKSPISQDKTILKNIKRKRIVAMVSRFAPSKGVDVFIEAAGLLKKTWTDVHFVFVGHQKDVIWGENYFEECLQRIHNLKLDKQFTIFDFQYDIDHLYDFFYCTVLPTRMDALAYPSIESQMHSRPVIITAIDGTRETVNYGKSGILIPHPPSPVLLAQAVDMLLRDKSLYNHYAQQGQTWVQHKYVASKNVRRLQVIYDNILARKAHI